MADLATRTLPLSGFHGGSASASVSPAAPASRLSLRAKPDAVASLSAALGIELPTRPKASASSGGRHALWLGPDEWLIIDETEADLLSSAASSGVMHSATDVSHRNTALLVKGPGAEATLNSGCPQDLSLAIFPVGGCSRTVFGKAEIVLLRTAEDAFRVECWRSFAPYVSGLLAEGAEDSGH
ncbi:MULTISPECIES: sarcosine oxidase subunit gamma [unclassified Rhizobium]|uniref:sarcosine oxidase subunit gamma family protein n=1 Tax=unclassified Rhizobium TaxID=2613769 RepID=UPI0006FDF649|nr:MULTISPECIES: sarcosine oxidase subunit gamma [unclassified Rhizobium]KQV35052.1 sarcosine oxidase subunit gamma [Rhizobium sp. Root1212]KRD24857.1 sarcosine oxidase subunit gamma [Rhizobium sp. Root268]